MDSASMRIHLFCCSTSLEAADLLDAEDAIPNTELKVVSLPCSGKVNVPYLVKAFESGADGVMVVTCKKDECQYIQGSFRAQNRVQAVDELIAEIGLGKGRTVLVSLDDRGVDGVIETIKEFRKKISALPKPAPQKATC
jgi:F420-non-reducing hydrogenase iron-sulfur subunit